MVGKAIARKSNKTIATEALKNASTIIHALGKELAGEIKTMTSDQADSIMQSQNPNDLKQFSWEMLLNEQSMHAPLLKKLLFIKFCEIFPNGRRVVNASRVSYTSKFQLILGEYHKLRGRLLNSEALLESTNLVLFNVNESSLKLWYTRRDKIKTLMQGLTPPSLPLCATSQLLPAQELTLDLKYHLAWWKCKARQTRTTTQATLYWLGWISNTIYERALC